MKIIKYFFEFISIISLFCIFKIIGLKNASNLGSILGKIIGPFFRKKSTIKKNIKIGLGNIDQKKRRRDHKWNVVKYWKNFWRVYFFKKF